MCIFRKKSAHRVEPELWGLHFRHPLGVRLVCDEKSIPPARRTAASFVTLPFPQTLMGQWTRRLQEYREKSILAINLRSDIIHAFSLVYDFADLLIIDPDSDEGIGSADLSDIVQLLDELTSLRLCYERFTPILLRLSHGFTPDEIHPLLDHCRLLGIDGMVASSVAQILEIREDSQGRFPLIGAAESAEQAQEMLLSGASLLESQMGPLQFAKLLKNLEQ